MSSILKALKKLEDENSANRPAPLKIDSDILRGETPKRYSTTGVVLTALLLFAGGSIATYLFMKQASSPASPVTSNEITSSSAPRIRITQSTDVKTEKLPESIEIAPAKNPQIHKTTVASTPQIRSGATKSDRNGSLPQKNPPAKIDDRNIVKTVTAIQPQPPVKTAAPVLRVNGIAFQDGTSDNVAIVNGIPVSDGAIVEGAKVESIHKNRVRFSHNGVSFEVQLGKSNR